MTVPVVIDPGSRSTRWSITGARARVWCGFGAGLFVTTFALFLGRPVGRTDESWMLWVAARMAGGQRLYGGVYDVTTPLAAWLTLGAVLVAGVELYVLRALVTASFVVQVGLVTSIARAVGVRRPGRWLIAALLLATASGLSTFVSLYGSLATLGGLAALRFLLWWYHARTDAGDRATRLSLPLAGAVAGFSMAAKPNAGLLVLAAAVVAVMAARPADLHQRAIRAAAVVGPAMAVVAITLLPLASSGSIGAFVDQVFRGKGDYARVGFSYPTAIVRSLSTLRHAVAAHDPASLWKTAPILVPIAVIAVLVFAGRPSRPVHGERFVAGTAFAIAAVCSVVPRPDAIHLAIVVPLIVGALLIAGHDAHEETTVRPRASSWLRRVAVVTAFGLVALGIVAVVEPAVAGLVGGGAIRSDNGRFALVPEDRAARAEHKAAASSRLRRTGGVVFVVRQDAAFWYLAGRLRDPLPYDYPARSDFGGGGEGGVIRRLERGAARWVCLAPLYDRAAFSQGLEPTRIEHWVRRNYRHVTSVPGCELYEQTTRPPGVTEARGQRPLASAGSESQRASPR